jgi:hypothetical protein
MLKNKQHSQKGKPPPSQSQAKKKKRSQIHTSAAPSSISQYLLEYLVQMQWGNEQRITPRTQLRKDKVKGPNKTTRNIQIESKVEKKNSPNAGCEP